MTAATILELIGQAVLPALGDLANPVPVERVAREVWSAWARDRDPAGRNADVQALLELPASEMGTLTAGVLKQLLPGRAGPAHAALRRYLGAVAALARRGPRQLDYADGLLAWLPVHPPRLAVGDRPEGVGDREVIELVRLERHVEAWLARNPYLPTLPPVLLAFYPEGAETARATLAWHVRAAGISGLLPLQHSFLEAAVPCLQLAPPGPPVPTAPALVFRTVVDTVARLHRLDPPLTIGTITPVDLFGSTGGGETTTLLAVLEPGPDNRRDDVRALGVLGQRLLREAEGHLAELLAECVALDPLHRPMDAGEVLARLDGGRPTQAPRLESARAPRGRRGADVWKVLDTLQKAEPDLPKLVVNRIGMKFVLIPAGSFFMGAPPEEVGRRDNEGPVHEVLITRPFYLGVHPVTQEQYQTLMGINPARFQGPAGGSPDHPVENVSWEDAVRFCARLGQLDEETAQGRTYRLPSEAEWEYACRAGSTTPFHTGTALDGTQARFDSNHPYGDAAPVPAVPRTASVGSFAANHFGLFDMHGNVWEWVNDWFDAGYYRHSPRQDPPGPAQGSYRVLRGGSWRNQAVTCRAAYRNALPPNQKQPFIGFRVVLVCQPG